MHICCFPEASTRGGSTPRLPTTLPPQIHSKRPLPPHAHHEMYPSNDESNGGNAGASGGCYVPDGGFSLNARFWHSADHNLLPYNNIHNYYHSQPLCVTTDVSGIKCLENPHFSNHVSNHVPNSRLVNSASSRSINKTRYVGNDSCPHICQYEHLSSSSIKPCSFKKRTNISMCNHSEWNDDFSSKPFYYLRT